MFYYRNIKEELKNKMSLKSMYNIIKRQNGERFARAIRDFDEGIFEIFELPRILKYAGNEAKPLLSHLKTLKSKPEKQKKVVIKELDLFQLARQAGYKVIYADNLKKQNIIKSLFNSKEELCTFKDSFRFQNYHIFHFIKQGAEKLKREDFIGKESRDDEYGTSVMSLQIDKREGHIKICNRYNHTVANPDNTLDGNPDNIIEGLTAAIEKFIGFYVDVPNPELPEGYLSLNKNIYRYNRELDNIYYGNDFYIKNHQPVFIQKDYQMIIDTFLIDFKKNEILPIYDPDDNYFETCYNLYPLLQEELKQGGKLTRKKEGDQEAVYLDERCFLKARNGMLTYIHLKNPTKSFWPLFAGHPTIEEIYFDNIKSIGNTFDHQSFCTCPKLRVLSLPELECIESHSIVHLPLLEKLDVHHVVEVQKGCLNYLGKVEEIDLSKCTQLGSYTLGRNEELRRLNLKNVEKLQEESIVENPSLNDVQLSCMEQIHKRALVNNPMLIEEAFIQKIGYQLGFMENKWELCRE